MKQITLWHGGRDLESDYNSFKASKKGRWEYGPGLYLTTHYERAASYAKGNGKTYLVTLEKGNDIKDVSIDISIINEFVLKNIIKSKQLLVLEDIYSNMKRMNTTPLVKAEVLLNLIIHYDAITTPKTKALNEFLVENNVDYSHVPYYGGRGEDVFVIFNNKKIKSIQHIRAKDVNLEDFKLSIEFKEKKIKNSI